jgi:hypothetical protein
VRNVGLFVIAVTVPRWDTPLFSSNA